MGWGGWGRGCVCVSPKAMVLRPGGLIARMAPSL